MRIIRRGSHVYSSQTEPAGLVVTERQFLRALVRRKVLRALAVQQLSDADDCAKVEQVEEVPAAEVRL